MNRLLHIAGGNSKTKMYERGPDGRKVGKMWPIDVCDTIRFEQTVGRAKLRYHSIDSLHDLIENPRFLSLNERVYRFKVFKGTMPKPWEYRPRGEDGNRICTFQTEFLYLKECGYNVAQSMADCRQLIPFTTAFIDAMKSFDREWVAA
jgi:hypothetical protein